MNLSGEALQRYDAVQTREWERMPNAFVPPLKALHPVRLPS